MGKCSTNFLNFGVQNQTHESMTDQTPLQQSIQHFLLVHLKLIHN